MINEWNKLSTDCINVSTVNIFKNKIDKYRIRVGGLHIDDIFFTIDKPMASLSTCPLGFCFGWQSC